MAAGIAVAGVVAVAPVRAAQDIVVNTAGDDVDASCSKGACSLRAAVTQASSHSGGARVKVRGGTYKLANYPIAVKGIVTVVGDGRAATTIDASAVARGFVVTGGSFTLTGLTMTGGNAGADGAGAIQATDAAVVLRDVLVQNSSADSEGGAVTVTGGSVELTNTEMNGNAGQDGGALLAHRAAIRISSSKFSSNGAWAAGGAVFADHPTAFDIRTSTFSRNTARVQGGAVFMNGFTPPTKGAFSVVDTTFGDNEAFDAGGAMFVQSTTDGVNQLTLALASVTFANNTAGKGGALDAGYGTVAIDRSTFTGNRAADTDGGAIAAAGRLSVKNSRFARNQSTTSGGAVSAAGVAEVETSSFDSNESGSSGAALALSGPSGPSTSSNTFKANVAAEGSGDVSRDKDQVIRRAASNNSARHGLSHNGGPLVRPFVLAVGATASLAVLVVLVFVVVARRRRRRARRSEAS